MLDARDDLVPITYTQHSVAFPTLKLHEAWHTDEVNVTLAPDGGGTAGEIKFTFAAWDSTHRGVLVESFGDGLPCLLDPRVQHVISVWAFMDDPDEITPSALIGLLEAVGAKPSEYHARGGWPYRREADDDRR